MVDVVTGARYDAQGNIAQFYWTQVFTPQEVVALMQKLREQIENSERDIKERVLTLENDM